MCRTFSMAAIFETIQFGGHRKLIALGTSSETDYYDLYYSQHKFGAFVRCVNIFTLRPLASGVPHTQLL